MQEMDYADQLRDEWQTRLNDAWDKVAGLSEEELEEWTDQWNNWVDQMIAAADYEDGTEGVWDYPPNDPLHMRLHTRPVEHPDVVRVKYGKDIDVLELSMFHSFVAAGWPEERAAKQVLEFHQQRQDRRPRRG